MAEWHIIPKPVILFIDRHSSHLTFQVSTLCEYNESILYLLPPNTTDTLQPTYVGPLKALKQYWRVKGRKYQRENVNEIVRLDVAPLMKKVVLRASQVHQLKMGFKQLDSIL